MRSLLIGNYGVGNLGDELLRDYFLKRFPEITWTVVSASPKKPNEVARLPLGLRSLFSFRWIGTIKAFRHADVVVFGGGTLFTDIESLRACFLWGLHAFVARCFGKPVFLAFQGVGPFHTKLGEGIARKLVRYAHFISVRDEASYERIHAWGLNKEIIQTFDPAISLIEEEKSAKNTKNVFIIIPRKNSGEKLLRRAEKILAERSFTEVRILLLEPENRSEHRIGKMLQELTGGYQGDIHSLPELLKELQIASFVLSERFHGGLAALALGIPFEMVSQSQNDKLASLHPNLNLDDLRERVKVGERALERSFAEIS